MKSVRSRMLLLAALASSAVACNGDGADAEARAGEILRVSVAPLISSESYVVTQTFAGRVEAPRRSQLGFELDGALTEVLVDEGDTVAAGDLLATLDRSRRAAAVNEARAALTQARSQSALAASTLKRSEAARDFNGISEQELDQARQGAAAAEAAVQAASSRLRRLDLDVQKSSLVAPYAARVVARMADEGEILAAGRPLLVLQESGQREVRIGVTRDVAAQLNIGDLETLDIDGEHVAATLTAVSPARNPATRTVDVVYALKSESVLPGDLARLRRSRDVTGAGYWVPLEALAEGSRGLWQIYVAAETVEDSGATHRLSARSVEIVHHSGERAYIRGAINAAERYVTDGLQRVVSGQQVRVNEVAVATVPIDE